jgi:hypothetical protein
VVPYATLDDGAVAVSTAAATVKVCAEPDAALYVDDEADCAVSEQVPTDTKVTVNEFETVHTDGEFEATDVTPSPVAWLTVAVKVPP